MKKFSSLWLLLELMFSSFLLAKGQDGEAIYKQNCTACHKFGQKIHPLQTDLISRRLAS